MKVVNLCILASPRPEIDKIIEDKVNQLGAKSATIGYKGYEHASCISINHVVCHGDSFSIKN